MTKASFAHSASCPTDGEDRYQVGRLDQRVGEDGADLLAGQAVLGPDALAGVGRGAGPRRSAVVVTPSVVDGVGLGHLVIRRVRPRSAWRDSAFESRRLHDVIGPATLSAMPAILPASTRRGKARRPAAAGDSRSAGRRGRGATGRPALHGDGLFSVGERDAIAADVDHLRHSR